jgi:hypothetical protein
LSTEAGDAHTLHGSVDLTYGEVWAHRRLIRDLSKQVSPDSDRVVLFQPIG